ncbi:V-set and immunoglobulin domain-containing protein 2-like [Thrips palmi]|uniref:V-set and immunoglobulin domain-containing protein 2-like n=1 Tax=Thrips palmi TaxID=161013 RepID=A0A6P8Z2Y2_THRPL|nr:V-set and immunoglobulin domain-containing protein 2-like [Thrips palmi]
MPPLSLLGIYLALLCLSVLALKDMHMRLPVAAQAGQAVALSCQYDLEGSQLYSIKWYRDDAEFYSFVPKEQPATRLYPDQGIAVDLARSDSNNVTLLNVTRSQGGFYKCEVSADMPYFHTGIKTEYLTVFEPPSRKPDLTVEKLSGGAVRANCSSGPSYPAANITWFIDNVEHRPGPAVHVHGGGDQDEWSSSTLRLEAKAVAKAARSLRCEASVYSVWRRASDDAPLRADHPQLAPVRGAASDCEQCPTNGCKSNKAASMTSGSPND